MLIRVYSFNVNEKSLRWCYKVGFITANDILHNKLLIIRLHNYYLKMVTGNCNRSIIIFI